MNLTKEELDKDGHGGHRLFKYLFCNKPNSPNGYLATYRFQFMDHTGLGRLMYEPAAMDGSSCAMMAQSLREVMAQQFHSAEGVHCGSMTREQFSKSIDANWNW